jgi:predicted DNA-binding transcriptional regulator YafY
VFYPYLLKEYRNRWFILGANRKSKAIMILALDRIEQFQEISTEKYQKADFDVSNYFNDVIGVTKMPNQKPQLIVMKIIREHAPYIVTKPMHPSQKILREDFDGTIFSIEVIWNFELEREILGFGEQVKVLSPKRLSGKIQSRMKHTLSKYSEE